MSEKPFKLNLGALKNTVGDKNSTELLNEENKKSNGVIPVYAKELNSPLDNILEKQASVIKNSKQTYALDLSKMKNKKQNNLNTKKEQYKDNQVTIKKEIVDNKDVFSNYESDFNKNKETVLQKVQKFKNFVKPKTRLGFLISIIGLTAFGIASLFIVAPEKHNLNNYKANLIIAKQKIKCKINNTKCIKKEITQTLKKEITQIDSKTLKKEIFVIEYQTKIINGKEIIIYMGKEYNSQDEFDIKIKEIISRKKIEKLKEFLLKNKKQEM